MEQEKINIPEDLQQICRELGMVAAKNGLLQLSGRFQPRGSWSGEISFNWTAGRHNEDSNNISITSQFFVNTKIIDKK